MENIKDFISAALPFVAMGVMIAVYAANRERLRNDKAVGRRMAGGMCIGVFLGLVLAAVLQFEAGLGASVGMMTGATIGMLVGKNKAA